MTTLQNLVIVGIPDSATLDDLVPIFGRQQDANTRMHPIGLASDCEYAGFVLTSCNLDTCRAAAHLRRRFASIKIYSVGDAWRTMLTPEQTIEQVTRILSEHEEWREETTDAREVGAATSTAHASTSSSTLD